MDDPATQPLPADIPRPPHAYIPGQTPRHPEGWFDPLKSPLTAPIEQTTAWRAGIAYLHAGYNWECHEVLEAVWLSLANHTPERHMTQALIQLANARLKIHMHRPKAAHRLCAIVHKHLQHIPPSQTILAHTRADVESWTNDTFIVLKNMQNNTQNHQD